MADEIGYKIDKFNGSNFTFWRMQIEDLLCVKNLYLPLEGISKKPEEMSMSEWEVLDQTALDLIRLSLSSSVAFNIVNERTTFDLMTALAKMYEKSSASNIVFLMKRLLNMKMVDANSVAEHLNDFNTVTCQLSSADIKFDDEVRALLLLSSLPDGWDDFVTAVTNSSGNAKLNFDDVMRLVLNEAVRKRASGEASNSALNVETKGRSFSRNSSRCRSKSRSGFKSGEYIVRCWNCGKKGHFKKDCKTLKMFKS